MAPEDVARPLLLIAALAQVCSCIRLEAVLVPQFRFRGQNATLLCKYDLEPDEELFSLKWYKEETEFYRYTPPDPNQQQHHSKQHFQLQQVRPQSQSHNNGRDSTVRRGGTVSGWQDARVVIPDEDDDLDSEDEDEGVAGVSMQQPGHGGGLVQTWKVPGIKIDLRHSIPQKVLLKKVTFKSTGMYRCEVTATVRTRGGYGARGIQGFHMKESINRMTVVELPPSLPKISVGGDDAATVTVAVERTYRPGDVLNLTCTSAPSNPPAQLEWRVNGRQVDSRYVLEPRQVSGARGLTASAIGLLLPLDASHFAAEDGELRVKCRGTIAAEFWENDVENVFTDYSNSRRDKLVKVLEVQESQWPAASSGRLALNLACLLLTVLPLLDLLMP